MGCHLEARSQTATKSNHQRAPRPCGAEALPRSCSLQSTSSILSWAKRAPRAWVLHTPGPTSAVLNSGALSAKEGDLWAPASRRNETLLTGQCAPVAQTKKGKPQITVQMCSSTQQQPFWARRMTSFQDKMPCTPKSVCCKQLLQENHRAPCCME